jgi:lipopolysaccharide export system protein LptC
MKFAFLDRLRAWVPILIPLLLLGATYWLNQQITPEASKANAPLRHDVDFVIENVTATTLNEQGQPRFTLAASKMWHYPDDNATYLQAPLFTSLNPDGSKVVATAQTGKVLNNGDEVFLYDDVKVVQANLVTQSENILTTDFLHLRPKLNQADSNQAVTLSNPTTVIHAIGMNMDLTTRITQFLAHVKAVHAPIVH